MGGRIFPPLMIAKGGSFMMRGKKAVLEGATVMLLTCLFLGASMPLAGAGGEVKTSCGSKGWYFAEGYTGGDFDTWILIQNPNQTDAVAHLKFFTPRGEPITMDLPLAKETRNSIYLNAIKGLEKQEVATSVECTGEGIVAERAMYFNYKNAQGQSRSGGHTSIGANELGYSWYMPEGYTSNGFDTYILLMNPNDEDANATLKLMKPGEGKYYAFKTTVAAGRRATVRINNLVWKEGQENVIPASAGIATGNGTTPKEVGFTNCDVSTEVCSNKPIVCERSMYFDYYGKAGGSNSIAASGAAPEWYLPEGYTGGDFDTWILAMNPNSEPVDITYTFYSNTPGFTPITLTHAGVKPWSRDSVHVDEVPGLTASDVSTKVTATKPVTLASNQEPKKYALLYGVEDTGDAGINYTQGDVYDIKHKLVENCGFDYGNMRYRTDKDVTLANLTEDMQWLAENAGPDDMAVFFFSGKSSADVMNNLNLYDGKVSRDQIKAYLDALQTQKLVGLFNCNNSGEIADELEASGRLLMSSCSKGEDSHEFAALENGAFPYYFAEALSKAAADTSGNGLVSAEEAFAYLKDQVTNYVAANEGSSQVPQLFDGIAGDLDLTVDKVPASIVAERSVYFKYGTTKEGHTSIGSSQTFPNWFLAEGYTGPGFDTYILVMNPFDYWQKVTAKFMTPDGTIIEQKYDVPPLYRLTIKVNDVKVNGVLALLNTDVSTRIEAEPLQTTGVNASCTSGVVAERAMYFTYTDPQDGSKKTGGSCSIGYGSW
jgi:Caspase domain